MDLESRILNQFYPTNLNGEELKIVKNHGIKSLGFTNVGNAFEFSIESPSVKEFNERKYLLNYHKNGANSSEKIVFETFSGLIGESIMRIVVSEFFRRLDEKIHLKKAEFIKTNLNPYENKKTIRENKTYILEGISRYNQIVRNRDYFKPRNVTEYDGLFEYETDTVKGLLICESKVGNIGYLKGSEENKKKIYTKIIKPIQSLFPEKQIDYLLMGTRNELLQKKRYNPLKRGIINLNNYLNEYNIGLIPWLLPETRLKIDQIATSILYLNKDKELNEKNIPQDNKYLINENIIRIIKGKRTEMILKKTNSTTYTIIYNKGE